MGVGEGEKDNRGMREKGRGMVLITWPDLRKWK